MNEENDDLIARLKASKLDGEQIMKQYGLEKAHAWCTTYAQYHQIKRLANLRSDMGKEEYQEEVADGSLWLNVAGSATNRVKSITCEAAERFWESVDATESEMCDGIFVDAFLEGCEKFWHEVASKI